MGNCEADPSIPLPSGHDLVRDSIDQAVKEGVEAGADMVAGKLALCSNGRSAEVLASERNRGNLPHRLNQALLHSTLTDSRIMELEKELYQLRQKVHGLPDDWKPPKKHTMHPVTTTNSSSSAHLNSGFLKQLLQANAKADRH